MMTDALRYSHELHEQLPSSQKVDVTWSFDVMSFYLVLQKNSTMPTKSISEFRVEVVYSTHVAQ